MMAKRVEYPEPCPEYPELYPVLVEAIQAGRKAGGLDLPAELPVTGGDRRYLSAFLRKIHSWCDHDSRAVDLAGLAANLHSSFPPPTLAQAKEAAKHLAGPSAEVVHAFLSSLTVERKEQ
jgi:hypothetical protein